MGSGIFLECSSTFAWINLPEKCRPAASPSVAGEQMGLAARVGVLPSQLSVDQSSGTGSS